MLKYVLLSYGIAVFVESTFQKTTVPPCQKTTVPPCQKTAVPPCQKTAVPPCQKTTVPPCQKTTVPPCQKTTVPPCQTKPTKSPHCPHVKCKHNQVMKPYAAHGNCPMCVTQLKEGHVCRLKSRHHRHPAAECMKGLECVHGHCVKTCGD